MNNKLQQSWQSYSKAVMPNNAPPIQVQEMRRAFYAGATAMLDITKLLGEEDVSEETGVAALEALQQEIVDFLSLVGKKY